MYYISSSWVGKVCILSEDDGKTECEYMGRSMSIWNQGIAVPNVLPVTLYMPHAGIAHGIGQSNSQAIVSNNSPSRPIN